jgi:hypothetical protein
MQEGALARAHVCHKLTATGSKRRSSLNLNRNSALNLSAKGEALLGGPKAFQPFHSSVYHKFRGVAAPEHF